MSLFKKKAPKYAPPPVPPTVAEDAHTQPNGVDNNNGAPKSQLVFHCQQAHGSPLGLISGFSNVKELYQKIAECYDFPPEDVSFFFIDFVISSKLVFLDRRVASVGCSDYDEHHL